jgi:hypothetical protein
MTWLGLTQSICTVRLQKQKLDEQVSRHFKIRVLLSYRLGGTLARKKERCTARKKSEGLTLSTQVTGQLP